MWLHNQRRRSPLQTPHASPLWQHASKWNLKFRTTIYQRVSGCHFPICIRPFQHINEMLLLMYIFLLVYLIFHSKLMNPQDKDSYPGRKDAVAIPCSPRWHPQKVTWKSGSTLAALVSHLPLLCWKLAAALCLSPHLLCSGWDLLPVHFSDLFTGIGPVFQWVNL